MAPLGDPEELLAIINNKQLTSVFQPIVGLQQCKLYGFEALIRGPANSALHAPLTLFDTASRHGMMAALEYACRQESCKRFTQFETEGKLFLNISPMSLTESGYKQGMTNSIIDELELPAERIVIELSEQYPLDDYELLRRATDHFRDGGFQIAIDDLGSGYAGLRAWSELRPDYVKIDRHFIEHINHDTVKREFVRSISEIAKELDCIVIAEGIETAEELAVVQQIGIDFGQGFFLGRPEIIPEKPDAILERVQHLNNKKPRDRINNQRAAEIANNSQFITPNASMTEVVEIFQKKREVNCLPIVTGGQPIGMIERGDILELFSQEYSRSLHGRKKVTQFMNHKPVIVSHDVSLESLSRQITSHKNEQLIQNFIITKDSKFYGIGKTSTLLKRITDQQIRHARYANPLTLLPGNVPINERLENVIAVHQNVRVAYFDLNQFKPFNDYFGYNIGDQAILLLSQIIVEYSHPEQDFVGHIGGDDFVVIFGSDDWDRRCESILSDFEIKSRRFYDADSLSRGGVWSVARNNEKKFFGFLSLAIGVTHPDAHRCINVHDIAALTTDAKKQAKASGGNTMFVSKRRQPFRALVAQA